MKKILRQPDVEAATGLSGTTIWRKERAGEFPPRRRISGNAVGWIASEIDEWIESRPIVVTGDGEGA